MSPTVFKYKNYRLFFFSREESRKHIHIFSPDGEAKFWIEPNVELSQNIGFSDKQIAELRCIIEEHLKEITDAWKNHFNH